MAKVRFLRELQRRRVFRVAATYAVVGWLLIQIATQVFPFFELPNWSVRLIVLVVLTGFPIALVLAWAFDTTSQGIVRTPDTDGLPVRSHRAGIAVGLTGVLIAVVAGYGYWHWYGATGAQTAQKGSGATSSPSVAAPTAVSDKSIAVLPFENLSEDKANEFFAVGIQDEILTRLSKIHALKVISRTSTMHFASSPANLPEIARQLGVAAILEGSVQKAGEMVHVNVQLIRAATDEHLWAESYNRKLDDIFTVQGEIAQTVAEQLSATLSGAEQQQIARKPTSNTQAYEAYLHGLALEGRYSASVDDIRKRIDAYQAAVNLDPGFALAWSGLSRAQTELYFGERTPRRLADAKHSLDEATRLAPEASETHEALGMYHYWGLRDYDGAFAAYSKALESRPNAGDIVYAMGNVRRRQGRWDEALVLQTRASEMDPLSTQTWYNLGLTLRALRRYDEAQQAFDRGLAALPGDPALVSEKARTEQVRGNLAAAALLAEQIPLSSTDGAALAVRFDQWRYQRDYARAITEVKQVLERREHLEPALVARLLSGLGTMESLNNERTAGLGHLAESRKILEGERAAGNNNPFDCVALAYAAAQLGDIKAATQYADLAVAGLANDAIGMPQAKLVEAFVHMQAGDKAAAIELVGEALALPNTAAISPAILRFNPLWDSLRDDPRFQALVKEPASGKVTP